jgi:hypothetical protein
MRTIPLIIIGIMILTGIIAMVPQEADADYTWQGKHLYADQWLYFEIGALDQKDQVDYGVRVTTPDESVNVAIMDSTNYAAFDSADFETFVGYEVQLQVRTLEESAIIPYQQVWYFVVIADDFPYAEIDIEYYVELVEEDEDNGICTSAFILSALILIGILATLTINRR